MLNYAFVFVRGGSKGLPGKNAKLLNGKPLLEYSIDAAKACPLISKVFVSTDDNGLARIAKRCGVEVIIRPDELARDDSAEWLAWRHAIEYVSNKYGVFDHFISLPATSPLRVDEDIENAIAKKITSGADICIAVSPASRNPYFNMVVKNDNGFFNLALSGDKPILRRQEAPDIFDITTLVYVSTPSFINGHFGLFSGTVACIEVPKSRSVDIDDIYDFKLAETILKEKL